MVCSLHMLRKSVTNSILVCRGVTTACSRTTCALTGSSRGYSSHEARPEDDSATAMLDMKAKKRRYCRNLQLRKNRQDPLLEKKAREGHCKLIQTTTVMHQFIILDATYTGADPGGGWIGWLATPFHLPICTGYYGNRSSNASQPPPIVQYSKVHVATHSATPMEYFWISA